MNSARKELATAFLLVLLVLVGVLVAIRRDRAMWSGLKQLVTKTEPNAAPVIENTLMENRLVEPRVSNTERNAAPAVKNRVRVSDYEARRRALIERLGRARAEKNHGE